jgi:hypothetical protein
MQRITPISLPKSLAVGRWLSLFKVCVTPEGDVEEVTFLKSPDRAMEGELATLVRTWEHRPYLISGAPVPYCYPARLAFDDRNP